MKAMKVVKSPKKSTKKTTAVNIVVHPEKLRFVKDDNCCLIYAIWKTLTKEKQALLTVSDSRMQYLKQSSYIIRFAFIFGRWMGHETL
jgi:hypothetical protein